MTASSSRWELHSEGHDRPRQASQSARRMIEVDDLRSNLSGCDDYSGDLIYNISNDDEMEMEIPESNNVSRCSRQLANRDRSNERLEFQGGNMRAQSDLNLGMQSYVLSPTSRIARKHEKLVDLWLAASEECNRLINRSQEGNSSQPIQISNCAIDEGSSTFVDLGDLSKMFWECFDAACLEDSSSAIEVQSDLELLAKRRLLQHGLTKEMVDVRVASKSIISCFFTSSIH
ncbi:unnamed protein product [Calypogeia fissa]